MVVDPGNDRKSHLELFYGSGEAWRFLLFCLHLGLLIRFHVCGRRVQSTMASPGADKFLIGCCNRPQQFVVRLKVWRPGSAKPSKELTFRAFES